MRLGPGDYYGEPFRLTSYQRRWIWRMFEFYPETSLLRYKRDGLGTAKGNGKTPFEGAIGDVCLAGPVAPLSPLVLVAASTKDQADLVFGDMREGIKAPGSPLLPFLDPMQFSIQRKDGPGEAKRVAAVDGSNDGPRATVLLADELHEWMGRLENVFTVLDGSIGKRRNAFTTWISTAGFDRTSLLGKQYAYGKAVASGEIVDDAFLFEWYEAPEHLTDLDDPETWEQAVWWANPALSEPGFDFLTRDYIRSRFDGAQAIPRYQWERYHLNRWTRSEELWLPPGAWDACIGEVRPPSEGAEIVLGFSGTYNGDSAGLVGATVDRHVFALDAWEPPDGPAGLTYQVPRAAVDAAVAEAMQTYKVRRLVVNPNGWHGEAQTWGERYGALDKSGRGVVVEFDWQHQIQRRADACSTFYTAVMTGTLTHGGDPRLARHLDSAQTVEQKDVAYIARGGRDGVPIELAIAAVMAFDQVASSLPPKKPGRFVTF